MAIVGNQTSRAGFSLIEVAEEFDEKRIGKCIIRDSDVDVITLLDWAKEYSVSRIYLVFPACTDEARDPGVYFEGSYEQHGIIRQAEPNKIVKGLWMNLTGSLNKDDVVSALKILAHIPFSVYECYPDASGCRGPLNDWLKEACNA